MRGRETEEIHQKIIAVGGVVFVSWLQESDTALGLKIRNFRNLLLRKSSPPEKCSVKQGRVTGQTVRSQYSWRY